MKRFIIWSLVVAAAAATLWIFVYQNMWCDSLPRTCVMWRDGAFFAYAQANLYAFFLAAGVWFCALLWVIELKDSK